MRRTIYVGVGGFGTSAVRKIKERITEEIKDKNKRKSFAFLAFDSKSADAGGQGFTRNEYCQLTVDDAPHRIAKDRDYSNHLGWYNQVVGNWVSPRSIDDGCNAKRVLGRFVFHYHARQVSRRFMDAHEDVKAAKSENDQKTKVVLISSLAGGTGSGMLLDAIFIISNIMELKEGNKFDFQVYLTTADSLRLTNRSFIDSNTYATLKELLHFSRRDATANQRLRYLSETKHIEIGTELMPDNLILVTNKNRIGNIVFEPKSDMNEIRDMLCSYILFEVVTPHDTTSGAPDVFGTENTFYESIGRGGMPRVLESIGVISIGLPIELLKKVFTYSLLQGLLDSEFNIMPEKISAEEWINQNQLSEAGSDMLQGRIRTDNDGKEIKVAFDLYGKVASMPRNKLVAACKEKIDEFTSKISELNESRIRKNAEKIGKSAADVLIKDIDNYIRSTSIGTALDFAHTVTFAIKSHKSALNQELNTLRKQINKCSDSLGASLNILAEVAIDWNPFGRADNIKNVVNSLNGELNAKQNLQIKAWSQEAGITLYDELLRECAAQLKTLKPIKTSLLSRKNVLDKKLTELSIDLNKMADLNISGQIYKSLLDYSRIKELYHEQYDIDTIKAIYTRVRNDFCNKVLSDIKSQNNEWIDKASDIFANETDESLASLTLETIMERFYKGDSMKGLFKTLFAVGSPLFPMLDHEREPDGYPMHYLIAAHPDVKDYINGLVKEYGDPESEINNAYSPNMHEVTLYTRMKGLTMHSLTTINEYKKAYDARTSLREQAIKEGGTAPSIHSWPDAENWGEVIPKEEGEDDVYRWFILGRAFSYLYPTSVGDDGQPVEKKNKAYIYNRGNYYYLMVNGKEERLGNSLEKSIDKFQDNWEFVDYIKKGVEEKIAADGGTEVKQKLTGENDMFIKPILDNDIETATKGRDLARVRLLTKLKQELEKYISSIRSART